MLPLGSLPRRTVSVVGGCGQPTHYPLPLLPLTKKLVYIKNSVRRSFCQIIVCDRICSMDQLPNSITIAVALLTLFLVSVTALKYGIKNNFARTRITMTSFFFFIVATLTISFWQYTMATLPFTIPMFCIGIVFGYFIGVRAAKKRLHTEGLAHYMEHFAHIHIHELKNLTWWSLVNFYSVMGALALINLVGISTVLFKGNEGLAIATSVVGAFLLGSIVPYLLHLWSIRAKQNNKRAISE